MNGRTQSPPTAAIVIAVVWLVLGVGWIVTGLSGLVTVSLIGPDLRDAEAHGRAADGAASFVAGLGLALIVEMAAGAAAVAFAIGLLRLRSWGRSGLEGMTVLLLLGIAAVVVHFAATAIHAESGALFFGSALGLVLLWPIWITRRHLRGEAIRSAVRGR